MTIIADILLVAGALGASVYCYVLARRLAKFNDLEAGVGGAVAVLSTQVDDLTRTLKSAQATAGNSTKQLRDLTKRAEDASKRMELLLASMHDLPDPEELQAFQEAQSTARFMRHSNDEIGKPAEDFEEGIAFARETNDPEKEPVAEESEDHPKAKRRKDRKMRNKKNLRGGVGSKMTFRRAG